MKVREWNARTAPSAEIRSLLETLNAVFAADLPDDPQWRIDSLREYLAEMMPGERRLSWVAESEPAGPDPPGLILGHLNVLLIGDIGVIELLVHPVARRRGLARTLLRTAARRAYQEGITSLGVEVVGDTPAVAFYERLGFVREYVETRSVLSLSSVDWFAVTAMARNISAGYLVEFHPGGPPDDLLEAYAKAKAEVRDDGDLDLRPSSSDPQRLRESLTCLHRRGLAPYIVLAIHERSGEVAGLTEVVVPAQHPTRADQYDTIVRRDHRGCGIDRAIKARMLLELRSAEPKLSEVQTWNAQTNAAMVRVNTELGFRADREWCDYSANVVELVHRLNSGR